MATTVPSAATGRLAVSTFTKDMLAALVSGQFAGLVTLVAMCVPQLLLLGGDALLPLKIIGSYATGAQTVQADAGTIVTGFLVHQLGPSLFWSLVFGVLVHLTKMKEGFGIAALGPMIGLISMLVDTGALHVTPGEAWLEGFFGFRSWFWHLVYGVSLCVFPRVRAWLFPGADAPERPAD